LPTGVPGLSTGLKDVIEHCLRADPRMRYQSVQELVDAAANAARARTLADLLEAGPADRATVFPVLARVVDAVAAAPYPLTPGSIWLLDNGEVLDNVEVIVQPATQPKYSAPDDFQDGSLTGEAVCLYVLGFIFYELLAGRQIFAAQIPGDWDADDEQWLHW